MCIESKRTVRDIFRLSLIAAAGVCIFLIMRTTQANTNSYFIIAGHDNNRTIMMLRDAITPSIDSLLQHEIPDKTVKFKPTSHQNLSLYYIVDALAEQKKAILHALDNVYKKYIPFQKGVIFKPIVVSIGNDIEFFGKNNDELVIKIKDPSGVLTQLHTDIKNELHHANTQHEIKHNLKLYDTNASERFAYDPHISLGRLVYTNKSCSSEVVQKVKKQIKKNVGSIIKEKISEQNRNMTVYSYFVVDLGLLANIKQYVLS